MNTQWQLLAEFVGLYTDLPTSEWERFRTLLTEVEVKKGTSWTRSGEAVERLGFVLSGLLKVYYETSTGEALIRAFCAEKSPVGAYSSVISGEPSNVGIEAIEDTTILTVRYADLVQLYNVHTCWREFSHGVAQRMYLIREKREYEFMAFDATTRYLNFKKEYAKILTRLTQVDIAAYLGVSPVTLNRIIKAQ